MNKMYLVSFKAAAVNTIGMIGDAVYYQYDYVITMKNINGNTLIDNIRLNEYYKTTPPADKTEKQEDKKEDNKSESKETENKE